MIQVEEKQVQNNPDSPESCCHKFPMMENHSSHRRKPKVIYIMGVGRSGSTLLDLLLGSHEEIVSVGELIKLRQGWTKKRSNFCSCGFRIDECTYWNRVKQDWQSSSNYNKARGYFLLQSQFEFKKYRWLNLLVESGLKTKRFRDYCTMTRDLYSSISKISGCSIIVDSSKNPQRAFSIATSGCVEYYIIHLIRDGRGVVWSNMKELSASQNAEIHFSIKPTAPSKTIFRWVTGNLECEWIASQLQKNRALRLRYEDLIVDPEETLKRIEKLIDLDLSQVKACLSSNREFSSGHLAGGNRVRMKKKIKFEPDLEWTRCLRKPEQELFWLMAGWLAKRYGYRKRS